MSAEHEVFPSGVDTCGCCEGLAARTPLEVYNRPGLSAVAYRVGTHPLFKQSMLARLSAADLPALGGLTTRDDDDFAVALLDAWATVADVLTFYQERIANESYLRTARERTSLVELARLIGYQPRPGVAASTYLAFEMEDAPGSPPTATIEAGTKVQSIPAQNQLPQTFETSQEIEARVEWNALRPRQTEHRVPAYGDRQLYLKGATTNLKPGDPLLIVAPGREWDPTSEQWEIRRISEVEPDAAADRTLVRWGEPLGSVAPRVESPQGSAKVYALRIRASLFGYNAPQKELLIEPAKSYYADPNHPYADDNLPAGSESVNLDAVYPSIVPDSWVVLATSDYAECYRAEAVSEEAVAKYTISAKTTRLRLSGENLGRFSPRTATVYAGSEELPLAEYPLIGILYGNKIAFDRLVGDLDAGRPLAIGGKRAKLMIAEGKFGVAFNPVNGSSPVALQPGDLLQITGPPALVAGGSLEAVSEPEKLADDPQKLGEVFADPSARSSVRIGWRVMDRNGVVGSITATPEQVVLQPATGEDPTLSEVAFIVSGEDSVSSDRDRTTVTLSDLGGAYDPATVTIAANVAPATHGEMKQEVLGSGTASPYQQFTLRESPLTYVRFPGPGGAESTLEVRVNDVLWHEVPTLYGRGPRERVYVTRTDDLGATTVEFGDGASGALLPASQENVRATYRKGIGLDGMVDAGQLSLLMTRPPGVKSVRNPLAPADAADPESSEELRRNAPLTVLTLDRVVSLQDYEDFARAYSGISKALATRIRAGEDYGVFVTVAGPNGNVPGDGLTSDLTTAVRGAGDPYHPLFLKPYRSANFHLDARVKINPDFLPEKVLAAVKNALLSGFSFDARSLGEPVALSEVITTMHQVSGVVAVDVEAFYRDCPDDNAADNLDALGEQCQEGSLNLRLDASLPRAGASVADLPAAELLVLVPATLKLEEMP